LESAGTRRTLCVVGAVARPTISRSRCAPSADTPPLNFGLVSPQANCNLWSVLVDSLTEFVLNRQLEREGEEEEDNRDRKDPIPQGRATPVQVRFAN